MPDLFISRAKPNPIGKDRRGGVTTNSQLIGEWVDVTNPTNKTLDVKNLVLMHISYPKNVWETAYKFSGVIRPNETVRIHSGNENLAILLPIDSNGANRHVYTERNYIWNNNYPDSPRLILETGHGIHVIDVTTYKANPPEGKILIRRGNELV